MLLYDLAFDVYPPGDPAGKVSTNGVGARLVRLTLDDQLVDGEYLPELFGTGSGFLEIHADNPDADLLEKDSYIQVVRMTGSLWMAEEKIGGFFLGRGFLKALSASEQKGRVMRWEGDGSASALDRYVLGHSVYATGQTKRGDVDVPGKWHWNDEPMGAMLIRVLEEGFDHPSGFYNFFDWDFTRTQDSNGNDWEVLSDYDTPIGTSGLKLWADFLKQGLVAEVSPDLTVHAYRDLDEYRTDRHSATFAAGKVRFEAGVNIAADLLKRLNPANRRTHVLYEDRTGDYQTFDEDVDGNPIDGVPYMTFRKSTTTADDDTIERMAAQFLTKLNLSVDVAKVRHLIGPGGIGGAEGYLPSPTGDYWLGDLVTIHSGTTEYDFDEQTIEVAAIRYFVQGNQWMVEAELGAQYKNIQQQQVEKQIAQTIINQLASVQLCQATVFQEGGIVPVGAIEISGAHIDADDWPAGVAEGDTVVVHADNVGLAAIPAAPGGSGWTNQGAGGTTNDGPGSDFGFRTVTRVLSSGDLVDFTGWTFNNTERITGTVYRNVASVAGLASTDVGQAGNNSTTFETPPVTLSVGDGTSWIWAGGTCNIDGHPGAMAGLTERANVMQGTEGGSTVWDTDGGVAAWAGTSVAIGANGWQCHALELVAGTATVVTSQGAGREELVGSSTVIKRCDDTEHWHEIGSADPTVLDDTDRGFRNGTLWVNDDGDVWYLADNTAGAADWIQFVGTGGVDLTGINFLVGTASGLLSAEIAVGTTPGGELGGTWASPTVDATHSGSAHHTPNSVRKNSAGSVFTRSRLNLIEGTNVTLTVADDAGNDEVDVTIASSGGGSGAPTNVDYLVGTADATLSNEIVVGTTPGGELGGTWASPTVDATHSGSSHADAIPKALVDAKGDLLVGTADNTVAREPVGTNGHVLTADSAQTSGIKWAAAGGASDLILSNAGGDLSITNTDTQPAAGNATGLVAGNVLIVDCWFTILNNSGATRIYTLTLDFDGAFDIELATGACAASATLIHPMRVTGVLDIRSSGLAYMMSALEQQLLPGIASGTDTTSAATHLHAKGWGTVGTDLTGTTAVTLSVRSAAATATQTFRLHHFSVRKY